MPCHPDPFEVKGDNKVHRQGIGKVGLERFRICQTPPFNFTKCINLVYVGAPTVSVLLLYMEGLRVCYGCVSVPFCTAHLAFACPSRELLWNVWAPRPVLTAGSHLPGLTTSEVHLFSLWRQQSSLESRATSFLQQKSAYPGFGFDTTTVLLCDSMGWAFVTLRRMHCCARMPERKEKVNRGLLKAIQGQIVGMRLARQYGSCLSKRPRSKSQELWKSRLAGCMLLAPCAPAVVVAPRMSKLPCRCSMICPSRVDAYQLDMTPSQPSPCLGNVAMAGHVGPAPGSRCVPRMKVLLEGLSCLVWRRGQQS